jgi:beta-lactamase regulating signal transducer with metallopeptidase domain
MSTLWTDLSLSGVCSLLTTGLLAAAIKGSLLLSIAGVTMALRWRMSASTRHMIWLLALCGALAMPLLSVMMPVWRVAPERTSLWPSALNARTVQVGAETNRSGPVRPAGSATLAADLGSASVESSGSVTWPIAAVFVWLAGAGAVALRFMAGVAQTRGVVRNARPLEQRYLDSLLAVCVERIGLRRRIRLLLSDQANIPFVWGRCQPVIILPQRALRWSRRRLEMVLTHVVAHIHRYDPVTVLPAWIAVTVYWFNPLIWLAARRLTVEKERASDDLALNTGADAPDYAEELLDFSRSFAAGATIGLETAFTRKSQLGERLMAILKLDRRRAPLTVRRAALVSLLTVAAVMPLAALADREDIKLDDVTLVQCEAIIATLSSFYDALNVGEDYQFIRDSYLTTGYFDPPGLTVENLEEGIWTRAFQNTLAIFTQHGVYGSLTAHDQIKSIRHRGDRFIVTLELNLAGDAYQVESVEELPDRIHLTTVKDPATGEPLMTETHVARALEHEIIFTIENDEWKISRYDGPIGIKRMDINNPYGPIFLVWLEDVGPEMTPYGQMISKVVPNEYRPFNNAGVEFKLEE